MERLNIFTPQMWPNLIQKCLGRTLTVVGRVFFNGNKYLIKISTFLKICQLELNYQPIKL